MLRQGNARLKFLRDEASRTERAKHEKAVGIAKSLLTMGFDVEVIAKASGLPESEIRAL